MGKMSNKNVRQTRTLDMCISFFMALLVVGLATIVYLCVGMHFVKDEAVYFIADECAYRVDGNGKAAMIAEDTSWLGITYNDRRFLCQTQTDGDNIINSCGMDFKDKQEVLRIESDILLEYGDGRITSEYEIGNLLGVYDNKLYFTLLHRILRTWGVDEKVADSDRVDLCCVPVSGGEYEVVQQFDRASNGLPRFTEIYNGAVYLFCEEEDYFPIQKFDLAIKEMFLVVYSEIQPVLYWLAGDRIYFTGHPWEGLYFTSLDDGYVLQYPNVSAPAEVTENWIYWYSGDFDAFDGTLTLCRTSSDSNETEQLVDVPYGGQHITAPKVISDNAIVYTDPATGKLYYLNPEKNTQPVPLNLPKSGAGCYYIL